MSSSDEPPPLGRSAANVIQLRPHVVRKAGPWSGSVASLLRYLEDVGFEGAPRLVDSGFDVYGNETVTFIEGEFVHPGPTTVEGSASVGRLLRELHDAVASYVPPPDAVWQQWFGRGLGTALIVGHCDAAPWNTVVRGGRAFAFIDWECAGPVDPLVDLAHTCWLNANLYSDDVAVMNDMPPLKVRARQMRALVDAYGLEDRDGFVQLMINIAIASTAADADEHGVTPETRESLALWGMAWRSRSAAWILRHKETLDEALR